MKNILALKHEAGCHYCLFYKITFMRVVMKYIRLFLPILCFNFLLSPVFAGPQGEISSAYPNQTGYFIGIGGSYNYARLSSYTLGALNVTSGFPPLGVFTGTSGNYNNTDQAFSPEAQIGYFKHFKYSDKWLWGLEFLYQYSNLKIRTHNSGVFINLINSTANVSESITVGSLGTKVNDTLMLPVFIGHSFTDKFIYLGAGPSLFHTTQTFSTIDDTLSAFYVGNINNFSKSNWTLGGAVQAGIAYYINSTWFLKLNYTCAFTGSYTRNNSAAFLSEINNGLNSGILAFNTREKLVTQEAALSINKVFSL